MIKIERSKEKKEIRGLQMGDLILIDSDPFLVTLWHENGECCLVKLEDGNIWSEQSFKENISEMELIEYVGIAGAKIEWIRKSQYEMTINIK
ncbi:hypothetical protein IFU39_16350 [Paenibacillus sp. CFBP 13594]|uniref:hypothetical protein n=1 Tax=Paenibacillus sp. CFBP 13594 TaxID=2774037 RepID=UPI0017868EF6|nr:hypothetical protein [Paenibacillus sp. CFBP 13594]MBD8839384.1 hypothetical protein [Paenibacillus sp. CFBP 13594]